MRSPLISVVIPTFNAAQALDRALAGVLAQTHRPIEMLIEDDGSTDATPDRIPLHERQLDEADIAVQYAWHANSGPAAARNRALRKAKGEYVCFLDAYDVWRRRFLVSLLHLLDGHPHAPLAFCAADELAEGGAIVGRRDDGLPATPQEGVLRRPTSWLIERPSLLTSAVMVRHEALMRVGTFDETLWVGEDLDLWYRFARDGEFAYTRVPHACRGPRAPVGEGRHGGTTALADQIQIALKHADCTTNRRLRQVLLERATRCAALLQEQMLRGEQSDPHLEQLLAAPALQPTFRLRLGATARHGPKWLGHAYADLVNLADRIGGRGAAV